jgi:hypothetical protein
MNRIINGCEVQWSSERVLAERQFPPNYGYLFDVSADRKRIVRCAHLHQLAKSSTIPMPGDSKETQGKLSRSFCAKSVRQIVRRLSAGRALRDPRVFPKESATAIVRSDNTVICRRPFGFS